MTEHSSTTQGQSEPRWQPLSAIDRRVAGVLVEKAKTTPDAYPMSLAAITTACNQKSNRTPVMQLEADDVEESLDRLRELKAVGMVEGVGRVSKYRHYLYEWLGVDKVELAVMAELLLRGAQTVGELRGRVNRMEPIPDLATLKLILASLKSKGLVVPLTPEGRGHVVTHALYQPEKLKTIQARYERGRPTATASPPGPAERAVLADEPQAWPETPEPVAPGVEPQLVETLQRQMEELRSQLAQLRSDVDDISAALGRTDDELRELKDSLGG